MSSVVGTARSNDAPSTALFYRADLDGLRAIAIAVVVMFHAGFNDWEGGYIGVDVFFVISGFLIGAQLIDQARSADRLDFIAFLTRRVRRLVPPAAPVLLVCLVLGAIYFAPQHAVSLAGASASAALYVSNYFFMSEVSYFAAAPETKPLLHFWSLSIEMQFYVLCFGAAWLALRYARSGFQMRLLAIALGACVIFFVFGLFLSARFGADIAFFDTAARLWELFFGVAIAAAPWWHRLPVWFGPPLRAAGLSLIVIAALLYDDSVAGPGATMLVPTLGAALIIIAPHWHRDPSLLLLQSRPIVFFGLISYSLYLWHWPVFSALHFYFLESSDGLRVVGIVTSLALAVVSYRYWEAPIRRRAFMPSSAALGRFALCSFGVIVLLSIATPPLSRALSAGGLSARMFDLLDQELADRRVRGVVIHGGSARLDAETAATGGCSFDRDHDAERLVLCVEAALAPDDGRPAILVIGDSHAQDAYWTLGEAHPELRWAYLHHGGGCGVAQHRSLRIGGRLCYAALTEVFAALSKRRRIDGIALATRYYKPLSDGPSYALRSLEARASLGAPDALPVLIFGPSPSFNDAPTRYITSAHPARSMIMARGALPTSELHFPLGPARDAMRDAARDTGLFFADRLDVFCDADACAVFDIEGEVPYFADAEHLTRWGRARLADRLAQDEGMRTFLSAVERYAARSGR
jgi:peptidoglycan/LPS O-acetylase OafA/YrhL